ncbi:hypothetical protein CC80DRAFT_534227 [Byssothecium circinans]|uniref:Uncharacterized protein n=1 Tax=Byssothecium circinans TaxID=147558 RepID=A0A6A5U1K3_9PLEO|nr:hypothetical protein CC80DRAFT_534227 [Byssothecium circinans]
MADSNNLPIRAKRTLPEVTEPASTKDARTEAHRPTHKQRHLDAIYKNWGDVKPLLPNRIAPRAQIDGKRAMSFAPNQRVLEPAQWSANLLNSLHKLSEVTKGAFDDAVSGLDAEVRDRRLFKFDQEDRMTREVLPKDVKEVIHKLRKEGYKPPVQVQEEKKD